jgi:hypothetical protein
MKGFLKKLLGGGANEPLIHSRSPRVRIPMLDHAVFVDASGRSSPLLNLSETGMALLSEGFRFPDDAEGEIRIGAQEKASAKLRVMWRRGNGVGVHFTSDTKEIRSLLRRVFGDEIHAQMMTEVDAAHQKQVAEGTPHWFYAPGNYELFYVELGGSVARFELEWNGNLLVFSEGALRFGHVDRRDNFEVDKVKHAQSALVSWAAKVGADEKRKAARLLENIHSLEPEARRQMQKLLG